MQVGKYGKQELVKQFDRFEKLKHSNVLPTAFAEQGLYMLATILSRGDDIAFVRVAHKKFMLNGENDAQTGKNVGISGKSVVKTGKT